MVTVNEQLENLFKMKMELELVKDMRIKCTTFQLYNNPMFRDLDANISANINTLEDSLKYKYAQKFEEYMMNKIDKMFYDAQLILDKREEPLILAEYEEPPILAEYKQTVVMTVIKRIWKSLSWSSCWS